MNTAELLVVGIPGLEVDAETELELRRLVPGGVILFSRNIANAEQLVELVARLRELLPGVLLYVDAEGGRVDRLRDVVGPAPPGRDLKSREPRQAERAGRWVGQSLAAFGIDVDLAPVVDLERGEKDNALDDRYLGDRPERVIARAQAFLRGLWSAGVMGCLKHFPGLGAARSDTHLEGAPISLSRTELEPDLKPFRLLGNDAGAVMLSHASYSALDEEERPATLSPPVGTGLLRRELGFRGVAFSDDLEMGALGSWGELPQLGVQSVSTGCDVILLCRHIENGREVADALLREIEPLRLQEALTRLGIFRQRCLSLKSAVRRRYTLATIRSRLADLAG